MAVEINMDDPNKAMQSVKGIAEILSIVEVFRTPLVSFFFFSLSLSPS